MKKRLLTILLLVSCSCKAQIPVGFAGIITGTTSTPTLVAHGKADNVNGGFSNTLTLNTTGANLLIAIVPVLETGGGGGGNPPHISDGLSNTWLSCTRQGAGSGGVGGIQIFYCYSPTVSSSQTFTAGGFGGFTATFPTLLVMAFSGMSGSLVDKQNGAFGNGSIPSALSIATPSNNNEVVIYGAGVYIPTSATVSGGSLSVLDYNAPVGSAHGSFDAYIIQTTATGFSATLSNGGSNMFFAHSIAAFK